MRDATRMMIWRKDASPLTNEVTQTFPAIAPDVGPGKIAEYKKGIGVVEYRKIVSK